MTNVAHDLAGAVVLGEYVVNNEHVKITARADQKTSDSNYSDYYFGELWYEEMALLLQIEFLKGCGCGDPESNVKFIYCVLRDLNSQVLMPEQKQGLLKAMNLGDEIVYACILYSLNSEHVALLDHDGDIYASKLTANGQLFMDLCRYCVHSDDDQLEI